MKYEKRFYYDNFNTGNYIEDKGERVEKEINQVTAQKFIDFLTFVKAKKTETRTAVFYDVENDARHFEQYIFYK